MHEMSLCEGIREIIEQSARRENFTAVTKVRLAIGPLAGVEIDALRFGFDLVMRGSRAEHAALEIVETPGSAFCFDCAENVPISARLAPCPRCGGARLAPNGGDEMRVLDLEVV